MQNVFYCPVQAMLADYLLRGKGGIGPQHLFQEEVVLNGCTSRLVFFQSLRLRAEFMKKLRSNHASAHCRIPILMLTALSDPEQRIHGLESGADDYLTKPFEPKELLLRIQNILNRTKSTVKTPELIMRFGHYTYDFKHHSLTRGAQHVFLTSTEQKLLELLIRHPRQEFSREELAAHIGLALSPRTVDVQVTRLRRKIEDDSKQPRYLRTVRHKGYILYPDD